jgi:hydroxyacylglutathione hydrolase
MRHVIIPVTPFRQNCTLLWCEETMAGAVVDPGGDLPLIEQAIADHGVNLTKILVTHGHLDHAGAVADLQDKFGLPVEGPHIDDKFWIDQIAEQCLMFDFPPSRSFTPDLWLKDGDVVTIGRTIALEVLHCPGHTPGHVVFYHAPSHLAIVGDVLFKGSVGRSDFPKGDHAALISSIENKLLPLGDDVVFIPGHGPKSTFGHERRYNPFLNHS